MADLNKHSELIARFLFFGCLMSQVKGWDGFWLDDFSVSGTIWGGAHLYFLAPPFFCLRRLFAYKSLLEPIVEGFEAIKTWGEAGGFTPTNSGVEWTDRMPIHARFTVFSLFSAFKAYSCMV